MSSNERTIQFAAMKYGRKNSKKIYEKVGNTHALTFLA